MIVGYLIPVSTSGVRYVKIFIWVWFIQAHTQGVQVHWALLNNIRYLL